MMNLREIKHSVRALKPSELARFDEWLRALLRARETERRERRHTRQKEILAAHQSIHKTYQQEMVRCGKKTCKCADGQLHGPYWYAYWTEGGRSRSQYIGKRLPKGVKPQRSAKPRGVR